MRIGFPWAIRCPVCIFGLVLDWPCLKGRAWNWLPCFKSWRNRSKLVDCLHIPLAIQVMFQSQKAPTEEMLSRGTLSCYHAIHVPSAVPVCSLKPLLPIFSVKLIKPPPTHSHSDLCPLACCVSPVEFKHELASRDSYEHTSKHIRKYGRTTSV